MDEGREPRYEHYETLRSRYGEGPPRSRGPVVAIVLVVIVAAGAAGWYWWQRRSAPPPLAGAAAPPAPAAAAAPPQTPTTLPPLGASDALVRQLAAALSAHPALAAWLAHDDLVRRFVASVVNVGEGTSPRSHVTFLAAGQPFQVVTRGKRTFIDPATFQRYDVVAAVVTSLDAAGTAALFQKLHPLLDEAYSEIGDPNLTFDQALARALSRLETVPVPQEPIEVVPQGGMWAFADHDLEQRTLPEKQLVRLGPENQRRVEVKLAELGSALGIAGR
jgi:hypothetical protein